jgi:organic radical activating enzyme
MLNDFSKFEQFAKIDTVSFITKYDIFLNIEVTHNCNFNCWYCYDKNNKNNNTFIDVNDVELTLLLFSGMRVHVDLLGGEPTLHKNIIQILNVLQKHNCVKKVRFTTNGKSVSNELIDELKNFKKGIIVHISYHPKQSNIFEIETLFKTLMQNEIEFSCAFMVDPTVDVSVLEHDLQIMRKYTNCKLHPLYGYDYKEKHLLFFKNNVEHKRFLKINNIHVSLENEYFNSYYNPFYDTLCDGMNKRILLTTESKLIAVCDNSIVYNLKMPSLNNFKKFTNKLKITTCKNNNCNCWLNYSRTVNE